MALINSTAVTILAFLNYTVPACPSHYQLQQHMVLNLGSYLSFLPQNCYLIGENQSMNEVASLQFTASITTIQFKVLRAKSLSPPPNRKGK